MSRRGRNRQQQGERPVVEAAAPPPEPPPAAPPPAESRAAVVPAPAPVSCRRGIVRQDSLGWACACGASGPAGRSRDGVPFFNDEILAHEPGERRV